MRFSCERCGKKYTSAQALRGDRIYKMTCKACGHRIVIRGSEAVAKSPRPSSVARSRNSVAGSGNGDVIQTPPAGSRHLEARDSGGSALPEPSRRDRFPKSPPLGSSVEDPFAPRRSLSHEVADPVRQEPDPFAKTAARAHVEEDEIRFQSVAVTPPHDIASPIAPEVTLAQRVITPARAPRHGRTAALAAAVVAGLGAAVLLHLRSVSPSAPAEAPPAGAGSSPPRAPAPQAMAAPVPRAPPQVAEAPVAPAPRPASAAPDGRQRRPRARTSDSPRLHATADDERAKGASRQRGPRGDQPRDALGPGERPDKTRERAPDEAPPVREEAVASGGSALAAAAREETSASTSAAPAPGAHDESVGSDRPAPAAAVQEERVASGSPAGTSSAEDEDEVPQPPPPRAVPSSNGLSAAQIAKVLDASRSSLDACIASAVKRDPSLNASGRRVVLMLPVQPDGHVVHPSLEDESLRASDLGKCLEAAGKAIVFPEFTGHMQRVEVPLTLGRAE